MMIIILVTKQIVSQFNSKLQKWCKYIWLFELICELFDPYGTSHSIVNDMEPFKICFHSFHLNDPIICLLDALIH